MGGLFWSLYPTKKAINLRSDFAGKKIVFEGDSITEGNFSATRWTTLVVQAAGAIEVNLGIAGKLLVAGNNCQLRHVFDPETIPVWNNSYGLYVIALGMNDHRMNDSTHTPVTYQAGLEAAVDAAIAKDWPAERILIVAIYYCETGPSNECGDGGYYYSASPAWVDQYRTAALNAAMSRHTLFVDPSPALPLANPENPGIYLIDGIHPTDPEGYALNANYILDQAYEPL